MDPLIVQDLHVPTFAVEDMDPTRVIGWSRGGDPKNPWSGGEWAQPMPYVFWDELRAGPPIRGRTDHALDIWSPRTPPECSSHLELLVEWIPTPEDQPCTEVRVLADDGRSWEPGCLRRGELLASADGLHGAPAHLRLEPLAPEHMTKLRTAAVATVTCEPTELVPGAPCDGGVDGTFDGRACFRGPFEPEPPRWSVSRLRLQSECAGDAEVEEWWTLEGDWFRQTWAPKGPGILHRRMKGLGWEGGQVASSPYCCGGVVVPRGTLQLWGESTFDHGCPGWPETAAPDPASVRRAVRTEKRGKGP